MKLKDCPSDDGFFKVIFSVVITEKKLLGQAGDAALWGNSQFGFRGVWLKRGLSTDLRGAGLVWFTGEPSGRGTDCVGTLLYRGILIREINHLSLSLEELPTWRRVWEERLGLHWMVARAIRCASTVCGYDVTVACLPSKQNVGVRFPLVAPERHLLARI